MSTGSLWSLVFVQIGIATAVIAVLMLLTARKAGRMTGTIPLKGSKATGLFSRKQHSGHSFVRSAFTRPALPYFKPQQKGVTDETVHPQTGCLLLLPILPCAKVAKDFTLDGVDLAKKRTETVMITGSQP